MKAQEILNIALGLAILIIIGLAVKMIFFPPDPVRVVDTVVQRDTVSHVDTVKIPKTIYITKLQARIDTVLVDSSKVLFAMADTTFKKDSSKVNIRYYFPPLNFFAATFDIKERIIKEIRTITETKTLTVELPFYRQITFWTTIGAMLLFFLVK